jgi:hypothetical protein
MILDHSRVALHSQLSKVGDKGRAIVSFERSEPILNRTFDFCGKVSGSVVATTGVPGLYLIARPEVFSFEVLKVLDRLVDDKDITMSLLGSCCFKCVGHSFHSLPGPLGSAECNRFMSEEKMKAEIIHWLHT